MSRALAVAIAAVAGAHTPHTAVQRFIENRSPADACAQLAPAYEAALAKQYGPCLAGMRVQPRATKVRTYGEKVTGHTATVDAAYDANGQHFTELYRLTLVRGSWLIVGAKQL